MTGSGGETPAGQVRNDLSGFVRGPVVQAGSIDHVTISGGPDYPIPSQLPPAPRFFTSRQSELAELGGWLTEDVGQPLVAVISGPAGVGKTTLALRWLNDIRGHFPGGQLYIDLGAFSGTKNTVTPEDALGWFLIALGLPADRLPPGLPQREALYRSLTADRAIAVLLDDALSAAQVRPLLPSSPGSVAAVTSRSRLSGLRIAGARFVEVDPLSVEDSVTLLHKVIGTQRPAAEHTEAEELARLCGGLPIALSVVGARLSARPHRSLSTEVDDLRDKDRLAMLTLEDEVSVEVVFDLSYEALPREQARLYRWCALHPAASFGVDVVAAMAEQPVDDVEPAIDGLVERNLLAEVADRRFRYHDLLRLHARKRARQVDDQSTRDAAVHRMVSWYLDTTVAADLALRPTRRRVGPRFSAVSVAFRSHRQALAWLMRERGNLSQVVSFAVDRQWHDLVWQLCEALWGFMPYSRWDGGWIDIYQAGVSAAHRSEDSVAEARLRTYLGSALTHHGRYAEAVAENLAALRLAEEERDAFTKATALAELGVAERGRGDLLAALDYLKGAKAIREEIGTVRALSQCRRQIGEVLADLGRLDDAAAELHLAAQGITGQDIEVARILTSLGLVYLRGGHSAAAQAPLTEALALAKALDSIRLEADILAALGEVAEQTGHPSQAREHFAAAFQLYRESGSPKAEQLSSRLADRP